MSKRNKVRYQSKPVVRKSIVLTGQVYLQYRDDEAIAQAKKGDLMVYPYNEALSTTQQGAYDRTGFSGYFKADVHDGFNWCLVLVNDIFTAREHHFSKSERPIDTFMLCEGMLRALAGKPLHRTYREHYTVIEE